MTIAAPFIVANYVAFFACLYMFGTVADGDGNAVQGTWSHFYFSAVTFTTLGYGNLVPVGFLAELVAVIEAVTGFFGGALLVAVLVYVAIGRAEHE